jgi:hypothetical protein
MHVNVQLTRSAAETLGSDISRSPEAEEVLRAARRLGVILHPVYPKARSTRQRSQFVIEVPDINTAKRVIGTLSELPATEAVYLKPDDELP